MEAFYCAFWKIKIQSSSGKFLLLPWWNLDFENSLDVEMSLKEEENKRFKNFFDLKGFIDRKSLN